MRALRLEQTRPLASLVMLGLWSMACILGGPLCFFFPLLLLSLPAVISYGAQRAGRITALVCTGIALGLAAYISGATASLGLMLVLVPACGYALYSYDRQLPFWPSVGYTVGLLFLGAAACLLLAWRTVGGDIVLVLRNLLETMLRQVPQLDQLLTTAYAIGVLRLPESMTDGLQAGLATLILPAEAREELLKQFLLMFETNQRLELPAQIVSGALLGGVLCVALPRRVAQRHATEMPLADLPPYHTWAIPHRIGLVLSGTLLAVAALMMLSGSSGIYSAYYVFWAGIRMALIIQGGALLSFTMRKRGTRSGLRMLAVAALFVFFQNGLLILGAADQFFDIRKLRKAERARRRGDEDADEPDEDEDR